MILHRIESAQVVYEEDGCTGARINEAAGTEYMMLTLPPGKAIAPHPMPILVTFFVVEGEGVCTIDEERVEAGTGDMVECPIGTSRGWSNEGTAPLRVLAIKHLDTASPKAANLSP